jgi:hypothetical protein
MSTSSEVPSSSSSQGESRSVSALNEEIQSTRMLLNGLIATVLVATIGINIILFKQMRTLRSATAEAVPQFEAGVKKFNEGEAVQIKGLINQLIVFSKTNPDFAEILNKYGINSASVSKESPVVSPAPGK